MVVEFCDVEKSRCGLRFASAWSNFYQVEKSRCGLRFASFSQSRGLMEGRTVYVTVVSAFDLKKVNHFGDQKCYAVGYVYPVMKQSTGADTYGGVNPIWNSTLSFVCYEAHLHPPNSDSYAITVEVFCQNSFLGQDKLVGTVSLPLGDILVRDGNPKYQVKPVKAKLPVIRQSGEAQGVLNLSVEVGSMRILEPDEDPFAPRHKGSGSNHQPVSSSSGSYSGPPVPNGQFSDFPSPGSHASPELSKHSKTPENYQSIPIQSRASASTSGASSSGASSSGAPPSGAKDRKSPQPDNDVVTGYPLQNYPAPHLPGQPQMQQLPPGQHQIQQQTFDPLGRPQPVVDVASREYPWQNYPSPYLPGQPQMQQLPPGQQQIQQQAFDPLGRAQPVVYVTSRDMKMARRQARRDGVPEPDFPGRRERRGGPITFLIGIPIHLGVAVIGAAVNKVSKIAESRRNSQN